MLFCISLRLVKRLIELGKPFVNIEAYMLSDQKSVDKVSRRQKLILIPRHTFGPLHVKIFPIKSFQSKEYDMCQNNNFQPPIIYYKLLVQHKSSLQLKCFGYHKFSCTTNLDDKSLSTNSFALRQFFQPSLRFVGMKDSSICNLLHFMNVLLVANCSLSW